MACDYCAPRVPAQIGFYEVATTVAPRGGLSNPTNRPAHNLAAIADVAVDVDRARVADRPGRGVHQEARRPARVQMPDPARRSEPWEASLWLGRRSWDKPGGKADVGASGGEQRVATATVSGLAGHDRHALGVHAARHSGTAHSAETGRRSGPSWTYRQRARRTSFSCSGRLSQSTALGSATIVASASIA